MAAINTDKIKSIFNSMEYGNPTDSDSLAKKWVAQHTGQVFGYFLNNSHIKLESCPTFELCNPSTGEKLVTLYKPDKLSEFVDFKDELLRITDQNAWSSLENHSRAKILYGITRNIQKQQCLFAQVESISTGRHLSSISNIDIPNLIRCGYHCASLAQLSKYGPNSNNPVLVISSETPSPVISLCWKFLPLLALGFKIILSVTADCCLTEFLFAEICRTSGLPDGTLSVILLDTEYQTKLSGMTNFYKIFHQGETEITGRIVQEGALFFSPVQCIPNKRLTAIVFESADKQSALEAILDASHSAIGTRQGCRLLVQESIYHEFVEELQKRFSNLRVGLWNDKLADLTSCITENRKVDQLLGAIHEAETENAKVLRTDKSYPVYLVTGVQTSSRIVEEQTRGVVIVVLPFRTTKESIDISNSSIGCDCLSIWTERLTIAFEVAKNVKANKIWINSANHYDEPKENFELLNEADSKRYVKDVTKDFGLSSVTKTDGNFSDINLSDSTVDKTYKLYYGGGQKRPEGNSSYPVLDNSAKLMAYAPEASKKDIRNAIETARAAQQSWQKRSGHNKAQLAFYLAENLEQRKTEFSSLITKMTGKNQNIADQEVNQSVQELFKCAAIADQKIGEVLNTPLSGLVTCIREPLGVIGVICPPDNPLLSFVKLVFTAACYGNTVVAIADESNPLLALNFYQILDTSDWPAGVINILSGSTNHLSRILTQHEDIDGVWYFRNVDADQAWVLANSYVNMKDVWLSTNWNQDEPFEAMKHSTRSKIIYTPAGETFAL